MIDSWPTTGRTAPSHDMIVIVGSLGTVEIATTLPAPISVAGNVICGRDTTPLGRIARGIDRLHEEVEAFARAARVAFLDEPAPVAETIGPRELRAPNPPKRPAWTACLRAWR